MTMEVRNFLNEPLAVGGRMLPKRLVLAPMAFVGNIAFRELVAAYGGYGLLFSEMCNAKSIPKENRRVSAYFRWRDEELPYLVCQIVGSDSAVMAAAAERIESEGFFGVDLNFGCSDGTLCRRNCGAALLEKPWRAAAIVAAVRRAVSLPLFVKYRTGWKDDPQAAVDMAMRFEEAGADALTFHPRVAPDRRTRPPRWEYIGRVKQAVSIPVFGNGNVFAIEDCVAMRQMTGCDGIAIGRMALARPWLFAEWTNGLAVGPETYRDCALALAALLAEHFDAVPAQRRFRRFAQYFSANFQYGHTFYTRICNACDMDQVGEIIARFFDRSPALNARPNMNFFL
jgi:tRNA-dihydrouridine synthase B